MEMLSKVFWNILDRTVGTKEQVYIRRRQSRLKSEIKFPSTFENEGTEYEFIDSGSRAEGLNLPGSDYDFMYIMKRVTVVQHCNQTSQSNLIMETDSTKSGFVRLRVAYMNPQLQVYASAITEVGQYNYLSSLLFRDLWVTKFNAIGFDINPHGPCATTDYMNKEYDQLLCFHYKTWPPEATEWITRYRPNNWPTAALIKDIVNFGCHIVPIGNPRSPQSFLEWRISFSLAEKKLVHSFNHTQFLCYALLKLYLKHVIGSNEDLKDLLCSYFLKTSLFYCIEEDDIVWNKQNIIPCFWRCFKRLYQWLRQGYCPNYFIRRNNMFKHKIYGEKQRQLIVYFSRLYAMGIDTMYAIPFLECLKRFSDNLNLGLYQTPQTLLFLKNLSKKLEITQTENEILVDYEIISRSTTAPLNNALYPTRIYFNTIPDQNICNPVDSVIIKLNNFQSNLLKTQHIYQQLMKQNLSNETQFIELMKTCRTHIMNNCIGYDISSGLLQLATLYYLSGEYNTVVHITRYVLSEFQDFTIGIVLGGNIERYMKRICNQGMSILQKMKMTFAQVFLIIPDCGFYPDEIKNEICLDGITGYSPIPPDVYCNILLFLSYNALGSVELRNDILTRLSLIVNNTRLPERYKPLSLALFAKCRQIVEKVEYEKNIKPQHGFCFVNS